MPGIEIVKITKKSVHVMITTKNNNKIKQLVKDWVTFNDACGYLINKNDIKSLLEASTNVLSASDIKRIEEHYFPTNNTLSKAKKQRSERDQWFTNNEKQLDAYIEKMANHPGFLGKNVY